MAAAPALGSLSWDDTLEVRLPAGREKSVGEGTAAVPLLDTAAGDMSRERRRPGRMDAGSMVEGPLAAGVAGAVFHSTVRLPLGRSTDDGGTGGGRGSSAGNETEQALIG